MVCRNICETWPSPGKTGYYMGIKCCSKCTRFLHWEYFAHVVSPI